MKEHDQSISSGFFSKYKIIILLVLILIIIIFLAIIFISRNQTSSGNDESTQDGNQQTKKNEYYISFTLVNFTDEIKLDCQKFDLDVKAKNKGSQTINYSQVVDGTLGFTISDSNRSGFLYTSILLGEPNLFVQDFGEIAPDEEKELYFYSKTPNSVNSNYPGSSLNGFEYFSENGVQKLTLNFNKIEKKEESDITSAILGRIEFDVNINLLRADYTDAIMRTCDNF